MNKYQIVKLESDELVVTEAENNQVITDSIPAFAEGIVSLKGYNTQIRGLYAEQQQVITGIATEKANATNSVVHWTIDFGGGIHSYAIAIGDSLLSEKVDFCQSEIAGLRASELLARATNVLGLAQGISADNLAHYGMTASDVTAFTAAVQTFSDLKSKPREAIIDRSGSTDSIAEIFVKSDYLGDHTLDRLALQFQRTAPEFYVIYKTARVATVTTAHKIVPVPAPAPVPPVA